MAEAAFGGDVTAHELCEVPADRQPESGPALRTRVAALDLHERMEDALEILRRDAHTGILDGDAHPVHAGRSRDCRELTNVTAHRNAASRLGELHGVRE